jgi:putative tryptophan/tyrosine transport system substrate-binding protein
MSMRVDALFLVFVFLFALASFVARPGPAAHAQERQAGKVYRIGFLRAGPPPRLWVDAFQQGLRERGYVDGQNALVAFRFTDGSIDPLPQLAEELVRLKVDVIVASSGPPALAAKKATSSVPIVFVSVIDPVEIGLVRNLGSPGGNITGLAMTSADLTGKRLEVLRELVPRLRRVAVLSHTATPSTPMQIKGAEIAARTLGVQLQLVPVRGPDDFDAAFKTVRGADGLLQLDSLLFTTHRARLVGLAAASWVPTIYGYREMADVGGLMSYGAHLPDMYRRAAIYVDKILKGSKPADLPVEQPAKFEFVINMKAAKALGLTFPPSLLLRADQVLE